MRIGQLGFLSALSLLTIASPALAQANNGAGPNAWPAAGWISWGIVGLIAGFLASFTINRQGEGFLLDLLLGLIGAYIGGVIFHAFGAPGVTGFNLWSVLVAFIGGVVILVIYHLVSGRRSYARSV